MVQIPLSNKTFLDIISKQSKFLFIFDYDGTLTPIIKEHNKALLTDDEFTLINDLAKSPNTQVSIVTGRSIANLKMLIQNKLDPNIFLYGSHGAEIGEESRDESYKQQLISIKEKFAQEPFIAMEEKPISLTIHYRNHPDREILISKLDEEAAIHSELFRIQMGHEVYEFIPKDINKGLSIEDLNNRYPGYFPIFFGDDLTDNYGFKIINKLNGLSIQVSERVKEREAGYLIDSVQDTYRIIRCYLDLLKGNKH